MLQPESSSIVQSRSLTHFMYDVEEGESKGGLLAMMEKLLLDRYYILS